MVLRMKAAQMTDFPVLRDFVGNPGRISALTNFWRCATGEF
jgi:hypothetical protein